MDGLKEGVENKGRRGPAKAFPNSGGKSSTPAQLFPTKGKGGYVQDPIDFEGRFDGVGDKVTGVDA